MTRPVLPALNAEIARYIADMKAAGAKAKRSPVRRLKRAVVRRLLNTKTARELRTEQVLDVITNATRLHLALDRCSKAHAEAEERMKRLWAGIGPNSH